MLFGWGQQHFTYHQKPELYFKRPISDYVPPPFLLSKDINCQLPKKLLTIKITIMWIFKPTQLTVFMRKKNYLQLERVCAVVVFICQIWLRWFFLLPCAKVKSQLVSAVQHELRREKRVKRLQLCTPSTLQSFAWLEE